MCRSRPSYVKSSMPPLERWETRLHTHFYLLFQVLNWIMDVKAETNVHWAACLDLNKDLYSVLRRWYCSHWVNIRGNMVLKFCLSTGKSFSVALILASTNPQYDKRLFMDLPVQHEHYKLRTYYIQIHKLFWMSKQKQNKKNLCTQHVLSL